MPSKTQVYGANVALKSCLIQNILYIKILRPPFKIKLRVIEWKIPCFIKKARFPTELLKN